MEHHPQARKIVETLVRAGFVAYYAGGWVRDFLLQHPSDDIDIATNAPPEVIQTLFSHTVPLGISFGIVLVVMEGRQYEVATFRQDFDYKDGRRPSRIEFATATEDAKRRDFTINGMFYDPVKEEVLDYVGGREDLQRKLIRAIGDPHQRIKEDRLRMIRAIRLAGRFGFAIDPSTASAIRSHAKELLPAVAIERVWQELVKGHDFGKLRLMLIQLHDFGLLPAVFPSLEGMSLEEVEKRLASTQDYPRKAPVIAFLLPLFPEASLEDQKALCKRMKLPNVDLQFVEFLCALKEKVRQGGELADWAVLYANSFAEVSLHILSAHLDPEERNRFLEKHRKRREFLKASIDRICRNDPVVQAKHLMAMGISPGKTMGKLLKEANRIAMNEQIHDPGPILERLRSTWDFEGR